MFQGFSQRSAQPSQYIFPPSLFSGSTIPSLVHLRKWSRIDAQYFCSEDDPCRRFPPFGLFDNTKLHEGSNDLRTFLTRHLGIIFLVGLLHHQAFHHICSILCLFRFFWYTNCIERRSRFVCTPFKKNLSCAQDLSQPSHLQHLLVFIRVASILFVGDGFFFFFFPEPC